MPKGKDEVGLGQGGRAKQEDFADRGCKACPSIGVGFESGDPVISSDTQLLLWSCRSSSPKAEMQRDELGSKAAKPSTGAPDGLRSLSQLLQQRCHKQGRMDLRQHHS